MRWEQKIQYASKTDVGCRRQNNQDHCAVRLCKEPKQWKTRGHLLLVADGMGGHAVGELASKIAADTILHTFFKESDESLKDALRSAVIAANAAIHGRGSHNRDFHRMGTTCTTLALSRKGVLVAHVGDSRAYRIRNHRIDQITFDHSLQWELIKQGRRDAEQILKDEPKNVITRSLGPEPEVEVDIEGPFPVLPGDIYLLCSDGLTNYLDDDEIGMIAAMLSPKEACRLLVHLANLRGGADNISVVIAKVGAGLQNDFEESTIMESIPATVPTSQLIQLWAAAPLAVIGVIALLMKNYIAAGILLVPSLFVIGFVIWRQISSGTKEQPRIINPVDDETIYWKPHRTAIARFESEFFDEIAQVAHDLKQIADSDGWKYDWQQCDSLLSQAVRATETHDYTVALERYSSMIDILMIPGKKRAKSIHEKRAKKNNAANSEPHRQKK